MVIRHQWIVFLLAGLLAGMSQSRPRHALAQTEGETKYASADEAFRMGVALYNSRNFKASQDPFEAALAKTDDNLFRVKVYEALLAAYREVPEFEPYQTAAEFIITHSDQEAKRSITRRAFLSFAYNRGQINNLTERYEERLKSNADDYLAVFVLSELYSATRSNPQRAIELLKKLEQLDAAKPAKNGGLAADANAAKIAREKGNLARQYVQAKQYQQAAELYAEIAPLDPVTEAWNLKESAAAWLKLDNNAKALEMAMRADGATPEARNDQLVHFYHRNLGDIFVALGEHAKAVPHYEIAVKKTTIDGYIKATQASLDEAKRNAN